MKRTLLIIAVLATGLFSFSQSHPDNIDIGLFPNGTNGSTPGPGADLEVALRLKLVGGLTYTATPAAEEFVFYMVVPKADFQVGDKFALVQKNNAFYGSGTMITQGDGAGFDEVLDIGDPLYYYCPLVLNAPAGLNLSSLTTTWSYAFTIKFTPTRPIAGVRIIDQTNNAFLISVIGGPPGTPFPHTHLLMSTANQLTNAAFIVLPVDLLSFSGYKDGSRNQLRWKTATEQNNKGFEVQRSLDGVNYDPIGFVNSLAPGGSSSLELNYAFTDNNVTGLRQYYRLRQVDFDGRSKISNIVLLKSDKPTLITLDGFFPNPATTTINMLVGAPAKDKIMVIVTDMSGRAMITKNMNVETGSNTLPLDIAALAGGSYVIKLISSDGEVVTGRFVKH